MLRNSLLTARDSRRANPPLSSLSLLPLLAIIKLVCIAFGNIKLRPYCTTSLSW